MTQNSDRAETLQRVRDRIETEGIEAAVDALIGVCRSKDAPAPAKSTAGTSLLRAAGFFDKREDGLDKELHEMTGAELTAHLKRLDRERRELASRQGDDAFD